MNNEIKYSFCEKNLMILPFISLKREPEKIIQREWKMINGEIANIKVVGGQYGVPQIFELDVLLALFNIAFKNSNNSFANISNTITFTYQELSEEIGYSQYSGKVKFLTYQTLADYLILDYSEPTKKRYTTHLINKAIEELVEANIIKSFKRDRGKGVNIYFKDPISDYIWEELSKLQISWEELIWLTQNTSKEYLVGVLKYIDYKQTVKKEKIKNIKKYFLSAFNFYNEKDFKKWNIDKFL